MMQSNAAATDKRAGGAAVLTPGASDADLGRSMDTLVGQTIDRYRVEAEIGRGGMAVVYKALQAHLNRYVALKALPAYLVHDAQFRSRFQREAETVAALSHPNILPIFDYGQHGDVPYIVMPFVVGGTL